MKAGSSTRLVGQLCSFQGPERALPGGLPGWSLKTQQYAPAATSATRRPDPVDMLETPAGQKADAAGSLVKEAP